MHEIPISDDEEEEMEQLRLLREAEESGDHEILGKAQADILRTVSNVSGDDAGGNSRFENNSSVANSKSRHTSSKSKAKSSTKRQNSTLSGSKSGRYALGQNEQGWKQSVAKLLKQKRHKKPVVVSPKITVVELSQKLCQERKNAALIRDDISGKIIGIITDADICKRVVAKSLNSSVLKVMDVMTPNPIFVGPETNILEIFDLMCKKRFRHLPVLDDQLETVYGLIDIAQCLYDAIQRIEKAQSKEIDFMHTVQRAHLRWNSDGDQPGVTAVLAQEIISDMMQRICPKVSVILEKEQQSKIAKSLLLEPTCTVQKAAEIMSSNAKTAVLGIYKSESKRGFGIFTTKDLMSKVVAKEKDPKDVTLEQVMTQNPDTVESDNSLLEALHIMHDGRFLHVPVVATDPYTEEESVVGILDVLDCAIHTLSRFTGSNGNHLVNGSDDDAHHYIYNAKVNPEADKEMFTSLFLRDDLSEAEPLERHSSFNTSTGGNNNSVNIHDSVSQAGLRQSVNIEPDNIMPNPSSTSLVISLKIKSNIDGKTHRTEIEATGGSLKFSVLQKKVFKTISTDPSDKINLFYLDEEKDEISLDSDDSLRSALALLSMQQTNKITVVVRKASADSSITLNGDLTVPLLIAGAGCLIGVFTGIMFFSRNSNSRSSPRGYGYQYGQGQYR